MPSFATPSDLRLRLEVDAGEVVITTAPVAETTVEVTPYRDRDVDRSAARETVVECRPRGDGAEVRIRTPRQRLLRGGAVSVAVRCPETVDVDAAVASAGLQVDGRARSATVRTASGAVVLGDIDGDARIDATSADAVVGRVGGALRVHSTSGDLRVGAAGDLAYHTASGELHAGEAGSVEVRGVSGDVAIDAVEDGRVDIRLVSGDARIGVREGSAVQVDIVSVSGELRSDVELSPTPPPAGAGGRPLPRVEVCGRTVSGGVRIVRVAAAPAVPA